MLMNDVDPINEAAKQSGFKNVDRYRARCEFLFQGLSFDGKRVLDVGCGAGALALWAGIHRASHVLGIEPESDGSTGGSLSLLRQSIKCLGLEKSVEAEPAYLEDLNCPEEKFDIVTMYNVINHIDEDAVLDLHKSDKAAEIYKAKLEHLRSLMVVGGMVIVADCGRRNFWNDIGLRNPLMPTIEWDKHQQPDVWVKMFTEAGFKVHDLRWSSIYPTGPLLSNKTAHYFTLSHFTLRFMSV